MREGGGAQPQLSSGATQVKARGDFFPHALLRKENTQMIKHSRIVATMTKRRLTVLLVAAAAVSTATALAGATLTTPNFGVLTNNVVARAGFADPVDIKFKVGPGDQDVIHVSNAQETVMQQVVIAPGGYTGWHTHPGPVLVLVKAGATSGRDDD